MKRFLGLCMGLTMLSFAVTTLTSCDYKSGPHRDLDSTQVMQWVMDWDDPVFEDTEDVLNYQHGEGQWRRMDSVFFSIPQTVLVNMIPVLKKQGVTLTKNTIVSEFEANKKVYLNLPTPPQTSVELEIEDEVEVDSALRTHVKDTTINGVHVLKVVK